MNYQILTNEEAIRRALSILDQNPVKALDLETTDFTPRKGKIRLVQLSNSTDIYIIDLFAFSGWKSILKEFFSNPKSKWIIQNSKFEQAWIKAVFGINLQNVFDTYLAGKLIDFTSDCGLAELLIKYLKISISKEEQSSNWAGELSTDQYDYAARDVLHLHELREKLIEQLFQTGQQTVAKIEFEAAPVTSHVEESGFPVNREMWMDLSKRLENDLEGKEKLLIDLLDPKVEPDIIQQSMFGLEDVVVNSSTFNPSSWQQIIKAYGKIGIDLPSTDMKVLIPAARKHPEVKLLIDHRHAEKAVTTYGTSFIYEDMDRGIFKKHYDPLTSRIHSNFWQIGAATGRYSSRGPNIQNISGDVMYRDCFRPVEEGKIFVICVADDTKISTNRGLINIKNITTKDRSVQEDGSLKKIRRVIKNGKQTVFEIITEGNYKLQATASHKIRVIDSFGNYSWKSIKDLNINKDFIALCKGTGIYNNPVNLGKVNYHHYKEFKIKFPQFLTKELALWMGYMVGDGSLEDKNGSLKFVVTECDIDVMNKLKHITDKFRTSHKIPTITRGHGVLNYSICSKALQTHLLNLGLSKSQLPEFIWTASEKLVTSFLRGLFEADGSCTDGSTGRVTFSSSRSTIVQEVQQLLLSLNILSHTYTHDYFYKGKKLQGTHLQILAESVPVYSSKIGFLSSRKKAKLKSLLTSLTGRSCKSGMPNLSKKCWEIFPRESHIKCINNVKFLGRKISLNKARELKETNPKLFKDLELFRLVDHNQRFQRIKSIKELGQKEVYDLTIEDTSSYIGNGFVNHNCDLSQIELRVLAHISKDRRMIEAFEKNQDLHSITAKTVYKLNCSLDQIKKKYPNERHHAKITNFQSVYKVSAQALGDKLGISKKEAQKFIDGFYNSYPEAKKWLFDQEELGLRNRQAKSLSGRIVKIDYDPSDERTIGNAKRLSRNAPIQSSAADLFKRSLPLVYNELQDKYPNAKMVNLVHDEIVTEVDSQDAEAVKEIMIRNMTNAAKEFLDVPVITEGSVGSSWAAK